MNLEKTRTFVEVLKQETHLYFTIGSTRQKVTLTTV